MVDVLVTFVDNELELAVEPGEVLLEVLGGREEALALQLADLFGSVMWSLSKSIDSSAELAIEVTGSLDLKASAGIKYLVFNVDGDVSKANTMKLVLKTKLEPSGR